MTYQNNNNRVNPNAVEDRNLKPTATVNDKLIRYQVNTTGANKLANTANALAALGKGVMEVDNLLRYEAQENTIKAIWETEQLGGNKKEWKEVSKNVNGLAKFNPYNDDAYRKLQANDIYRAAALEISTYPELEKLDPEKYNQLVSDTNKKMLNGFKETGLSPKDYGDAVVQWNNQISTLQDNYVTKHAEYKYKQLATKQASDLSFQAGVALAENTGLDKTVVLQDVINSKIQEMNELGMPEDTQGAIILSGMKGFLAKNADSITSAEFKMAISNLEINGKKASELIPDFDYSVNQLYKEAQRAIYEDKHIQYQNHQLDLKIAEQSAMKDLYDWTQQNPNASYDETYQQARDLISKYGLEEIGFSFINEMARDKSTITELQSVQSDPATLQELGAKAALGTLTGEDINQAVLDRKLNWKDALSFTDRINREAKADMVAVKKQATTLSSQFKKSGIYNESVLGKTDSQELNNQTNQVILDLQNGKITPEIAQKKLSDIERIAAAKKRIKNFKVTNDFFLLNANYIKSQAAPAYNSDRAIQAFKQLALERGRVGQKIQPQVTSAPNDNRRINGKASPHKGYDLSATTDTRIHSAPMDGVCIFAGYTKDFGNYAVIKYSNGSYMRVGHLSTSTYHLQNKKIAAGQYIGNAGSTGFSTGTHLHVDFWDKNRQLIGVERFQRGIR